MSRLEQIKRRWAEAVKANPKPWMASEQEGGHRDVLEAIGRPVAEVYADTTDGLEATARAIAAYPEDVGYLFELVERLCERVDDDGEHRDDCVIWANQLRQCDCGLTELLKEAGAKTS